jgi:hypothetical protein
MAKLLVLMCLLWPHPLRASINPQSTAEGVSEMLGGSLEDRQERTLTALDVLVRSAAVALRDVGRDAKADEVMSDWLYRQRGFLLDELNAKDLGDHEPIEWLYDLWFTLNELLGEGTMRMMHLDDLYIFAYAIPVVFWCLDAVDELEYALHFVPFSGAVTYWAAMAACQAAAFGTAWTLICSPVASVAELAMIELIAPGLSPRVWELACSE